MKKDKIISIIIFCIFFSLIVFFAFYHENWRDEAQAYLLCRDMNLIEFIKNIHYEGHPFFYYLFLFPLVKIGFGPKIVNILSIVFMSISVFLILFRTKLNVIQKIAIIVTYPVLYEFSIVGRSYSLIFLLLTLYGIYYSKRREHPIIFSIILGCLLNTHLLVAGFVGINTLLFHCYELFIKRKNNDSKTNKNILIGFIIVMFFALLLFIQFVPMLFSNDGLGLHHSSSFMSYFSIFFELSFGFTGFYSFIPSILSIVVILFIYFVLFKQYKKYFLIIMISYLFMSIFMTFIHYKVALYSLMLAFSIFIAFVISLDGSVKNNNVITICFCILSILTLPLVIFVYKYDFSNNYSSAYETSQYIRKNISEDAIMICSNDSYCSSIIPYVKNKFYNTHTNKYFTYIVWNSDREKDSDVDVLFSMMNQNSDLYFIYCDYYDDEKNVLKELKKHYFLENSFLSSKTNHNTNEKYTIYKIKDKKS